MRIAFLSPSLELHGGTLVLQRYANHLARTGHEVTIIAPRRSSALSFDSRVKIKTFPALQVRYLDTLLLQRPYYRKFDQLLDSKTELLIPIYTPLLAPSVLWAKRHNARVILLAQESFEMFWIGPWNKRILTRYSGESSLAGLITISRRLSRQLKKLLPRQMILTVVNGLDHQVFKPRPLAKKNYLLFVGRPIFPKGFPTFKKAFEELRKSDKTLQAVVVAPDVADQIVEGLRYVRFQNSEQLAKLYSQAWAYICASQAESFGLPPLEAMAAGTPVISTKTDGVKEYARDQENCLLVPLNDPPALVRAVKKLRADKQLYRHLVSAGRATARRYDWKKSCTEFAQAIKKLTNSD